MATSLALPITRLYIMIKFFGEDMSKVKIIQSIGISFLLLGVLLLVGFGIYAIVIADDIPLYFKMPYILIILGFFVLLGVVVFERLRTKKTEGKLEEVEY
jgi:hypothetical protein